MRVANISYPCVCTICTVRVCTYGTYNVVLYVHTHLSMGMSLYTRLYSLSVYVRIELLDPGHRQRPLFHHFLTGC